MKTLNTLIHLLCALLIFLIVGTKVVVGQTWESNDIGLEAGNVAGQTSSVNDHTHSISGGGRGIEGSSDSFYFMSRQTLGDIELDVRITAFEGNEQAEAGLMIRQSLASDAVFAGVFINTLGEMHFKYRSETGDNVDILLGDVANPTNEIWLKIVYSGSIVAGYYSNDGINWDQVGLKSVQFSGFVKAGVVVTNGMPDALAEVACDHVQIIENVPQRLSKTVSGNAPSPILWLRSDWGVAHDDSKVTKWADYSGHANDATSTTPAGGVIDNRPLLVRDMMGLKPVIRFDNAGLSSLAERKFLRVEDRTSLNPDMVSIFVVSRWPSGQAGLAGMISKGGSSKGYTLGFKDNVLRLHIPTHVESFGAAVPANETYLVEGLFSTTSEPLSGLRVFVNAQQSPLPIPQRSAKISSNTFPLFIGQYLTSPSVTEPSSTQAYPFNGEIAEILIYNKVVPEFQRQRIEAYFKGKYNISGLPKPKLNQPTINQPGGIFDSSREVTISAQGSTIYYRANGGDVQIYAGPIVLPEGVTEIAAWTSHPGFTDSNIVAATYIVDTLSKYLSRQGLRLWLRSDAGIVKSNDGEIMEWRSQASSFSAQSGSTGKPLYIETGDAAINGKPSIEFNNDWLRVTASGDLNPLALNKHTICVVAQPSASIASSTSGTASAMVARHNTANGYWFGLWGTPATGGGVNLQMRKRLLLSSVSEVVQSPVNKAFAAGSWMALTTRFDLERNNLQSNGVDLFSANRTSAIGDSKTDLFIGAQSLSSGNPVVPFMGKIAEVIVFDRELSDDELREMNVYLNLRYQMQGTSLAPLVDLQTSPPAGLYAAEPTVLCTSKDDAQITYTVNDGEAIDYVDGINLAQFTGETVSVNVKRYRLKISAAKAGFNSVIDRSLTYFVEPIPKPLAFRHDGGITNNA